MYTQADLANLSDEEKGRKKHSLQMEIIMRESDLRKMNAEKNNLDAEIRKFNYDMERLRIELDDRKNKMEKVTFDISENETEIKRMKKQLNLL